MSLWIERLVQIIFGLMLCGASIMVLATILERLDAFKKASAAPPGFRDELQRHLENSNPAEALSLCERTTGPAAAVAVAGLRRCRALRKTNDNPTVMADMHHYRRIEEKLDDAMQQQGDRELSRLEENLLLLSTLGGIAPLMGFLGTVGGMIMAFQNIAAAGMGKPQTVAGGISTALITTAAGLVIAIPAIASHNYFTHRVKAFLEDMNETASMVLHALMTEIEDAT